MSNTANIKTGKIKTSDKAFKVRRIVTGEKNGRSLITSDDIVKTTVAMNDIPEFVTTDVWKTNTFPNDYVDDFSEDSEYSFSLEPTPHGSILRLTEFIPNEDLIKQSGVSSPQFHTTDTVDYGVVLRGEITLLTDTSETLVRQGDIVIMRGVNHAWVNNSAHSTLMLFVLMAGKQR